MAAECDSAAWLGLLLTPGLGLRSLHRLLEVFSSAEAVFAASLTELEGAQLPSGAAQSIHSGQSRELGEREAAEAAGRGVSIVPLRDRRYPQLLREIYDPPIVLYVLGSPAALDTFSLAIVGTRHPTVYGRLMAECFGREAAAYGLAVVSGLARGIDAIGQKACVDSGGVTVAVLGSGVDVIYPKEHETLAEKILASNGAVISEFPMGTFAAAQNFPIRNRVISGLSLGVLIVEGGEFSGSRITSRMALEQNREVFAVPGMVTQKQAWLPNALIKQGAKLVTAMADVVDELPSSVRLRLATPVPPSATPANSEMLASSSRLTTLLDVLMIEQPSHVDEIADRLENKLTAPEILAQLFELEIAGKVRQLPGKNYLRVC